MLIYDDFIKKYQVIFKKFAFLKVFRLLSINAKFQVQQITVLYPEKNMVGGNFTLNPRRGLLGQNISVGIWLIEVTEPSDTLNFNPFFKHCILHVFSLFIFVWSKIFCSKDWAVFYIFLIWFGVEFGVTVLKALFFWCTFYKAIGNYGFISYSRYNLLGIEIKVAI